jgi:hypothetical protein
LKLILCAGCSRLHRSSLSVRQQLDGPVRAVQYVGVERVMLHRWVAEGCGSMKEKDFIAAVLRK